MGFLDAFEIKEVVAGQARFSKSSRGPVAFLNKSDGFSEHGLASGAPKASFSNSEEDSISSDGCIFDFDPPAIVDGEGFGSAFRADFE